MPANPLERALAPAESGLGPFYFLPFTVFYQTDRLDLALVAALVLGILFSLTRAFLTPTQAPEAGRAADRPSGLVIAPESPAVPLRPEHVAKPEPPFTVGRAVWKAHNLALHALRRLAFIPTRKLAALTFIAVPWLLPRDVDPAWGRAFLWAGAIPLAASVISYISLRPSRTAAEIADILAETRRDQGRS